MLRAGFSVIKKVLDDFTEQKINMFGKDFQPKLHLQVDPNNLEQKFGGNLPNKSNNFFPPDMSLVNEQLHSA